VAAKTFILIERDLSKKRAGPMMGLLFVYGDGHKLVNMERKIFDCEADAVAHYMREHPDAVELDREG